MHTFYDFLMTFATITAKYQSEYLRRMYPGLYETAAGTTISAKPAKSVKSLSRLDALEAKSQ